MNGRLVRKTLSYFRQVEMLKAASAWEEPDPSCQNIASGDQRGLRRWQPRSPAMAAGLIDYIWAVKELLMTVISPEVINTE